MNEICKKMLKKTKNFKMSFITHAYNAIIFENEHRYGWLSHPKAGDRF